MGNEVYNEQRSEVNELAEGYAQGKVGSSTMPHKRNPFLPGAAGGRGRIAGTLVMRAMQCLENTNERDCRTLCIEPYHLKEICCLADGTLDIALELFGQMEVHEDQIGHNLEILQGLIYSEALMMRLAEVYGRMEAHELVYELAMAAIGQKRQLKELALADSRRHGPSDGRRSWKISCARSITLGWRSILWTRWPGRRKDGAKDR